MKSKAKKYCEELVADGVEILCGTSTEGDYNSSHKGMGLTFESDVSKYLFPAQTLLTVQGKSPTKEWCTTWTERGLELVLTVGDNIQIPEQPVPKTWDIDEGEASNTAPSPDTPTPDRIRRQREAWSEDISAYLRTPEHGMAEWEYLDRGIWVDLPFDGTHTVDKLCTVSCRRKAKKYKVYSCLVAGGEASHLPVMALARADKENLERHIAVHSAVMRSQIVETEVEIQEEL